MGFMRNVPILKNQIITQSIYRHLSNLSYKHNVGKEPLVGLTIGTLLENTAKRYGDRSALISRHQHKSITFRDLLKESDKFAAGFRKLDLQKGDRVGIWAPNCIEWEVLLMACARAGLIGVQINPAYQANEIEYCINKVAIKSIVCPHYLKKQNYVEILNQITSDELSKSEPGKLSSSKIPSLKSVILLTEETIRGTYNYNEILEMSTENGVNSIKNNQNSVGLDDGCNIQFTSGTTGHPKAALLSHFNVVNNSNNIGKRMELDTKHHRICIQVPFFHTFGTTIGIVAALNHGTTLVVPNDLYDPHKSLDAIVEEKCTIIYGTPTMYVDLTNIQKERKEKISPELAVTGGAPCSPSLFASMLETLNLKNVMSVFGMTETTAVIFQSFRNDVKEKVLDTVGHVGDSLEVKVVDENDNLVPLGQTGELCVRGYANMLQYWEDEDKTDEIMRRDRWLRTGDQFILYEDGYGKIVGRFKDMIIRGGENIFPKEIEDFLNTHPNIIESQVIGLPHTRLGEEVCVCVRLDPKTELTHEELIQFCKGQIAHYKIPTKFFIYEQFPKTASGKIQKFKLVQELSTK